MRSSSIPFYSVTKGLQERFDLFVQSLGADPSLSETWSTAFIARYTELQRHYHTVNHVAAMLGCLDKHQHEVSDPLAVELAIIFHDWIYDPQGKKNEAESIVEFETRAKEIQLDKGLTAKVSRFIDATVAHQIGESVPSDEKSDLSFFLDFDLEVLSRNWEDYSTYAKQIRQEYICYNDEEYRSGRARVLRNFLARERIYFSKPFYEASETVARDNLQREIESLETTSKPEVSL
jgi:predicted metal-dependent HD superfamily phosphohydrolase